MVASNPAVDIRAPKAAKRLPSTLDVDQINQLLDIPGDDPLAVRDRAIMELFYSSGLRLSELCALRWQDLDLEDGLVTVIGKGNKQRRVPVGSFARAALKEWKADQGATSDAFVFPGRNGPISARGVQARLRTLANRCEGRM